MNKLSGYKAFTLEDGTVVELKFCNGATELYADAMGFTTVEQVTASLQLQTETVDGEDGQKVEVPKMSIANLKAFRQYVLAGIRYAALAQGKPDNFNEWVVSEWIQEIGMIEIFNVIERPSEEAQEAAKKKPVQKLSQRVRASQ